MRTDPAVGAMDHRFLIATLGGTDPSVLASLAHWKPERVCFVAEESTIAAIQDSIVPAASRMGVDLDSGRWNVISVSGEPDLEACVLRLRPLTSEVEEWLARGTDHRVVVDFTDGSKCLSIALALHARRWPCTFSYVCDSESSQQCANELDGRDVVQRYNPWDTLGYQAIEDACDLFNRGHFAAAAGVLKSCLRRAESPTVKRELATLWALARAYAEWDRFDHAAARSSIAEAIKNANDLRVILGSEDGDHLFEVLLSHRHVIENCSADPVADLIANATRRARAGRWDDAVARLYRAVEAIAQAALRRHGLDTSRIPLAQLPEPLHGEWQSRANADGTCSAGLQDAYRLLVALGDPLGNVFLTTELVGPTSPLTARNQSILAHGFQPIGEPTYRALLDATLALSGLSERDLPAFPVLELLPANELRYEHEGKPEQHP